MIKKIIDFIRHGVWQKTELYGKKGWLVKQLRVVIFTAKGFGRHGTAIRSAALSFFTIMSLVPILALVFAVFKGFGMEETFVHYLYDLLPAESYRTIVDQLVVFVGNLLERTRGGVMAVSAFFVLIWAVIQVFGNVEGAFNKIWEVKRSRSFARRFSAYMALVILVPILFLAANSLYVGIRRQIEVLTGTIGAEILFGVLSVAILVVMFSIVYFVLPNTDVRYRNALKAGIVAGIGFGLFQVIYVFIQSNLSSYNAIYGTFAAIPLFLIWLQISWQIVLFGGELSYAMQNIRDFESEQQEQRLSYDNRCKVMIAVMVITIRDYLGGESLSTIEGISRETGVPVRTLRDVAGELEDDGLLLFVLNDKTDKEDYLAPARDPHTMRFFDVISSVTSHGDDFPDLRRTALLEHIDKAYEKVKGDVNKTEDNVLLTSLI